MSLLFYLCFLYATAMYFPFSDVQLIAHEMCYITKLGLLPEPDRLSPDSGSWQLQKHIWQTNTMAVPIQSYYLLFQLVYSPPTGSNADTYQT